MIYLDSSALLKLLFREQETDALGTWLAAREEPAVSSELARVEVLRATRRLDEAALPDARALLGRLDLVPLSGAVVDEAGELRGATLRSLDALHLASALSLRHELTAVVVYDLRLAGAVRAEGLPLVSPGG